MYFPALNSDDGINILMVHSFKIPENLYFWGQDRYGSLIPLLANPICVFFSIRAEIAESIVHFGILILGFFSLAYFLKTILSKLLFAFVFFFPPYHMIEFFRNNIGLSYCLLGIILYLIAIIKTKELEYWKKHFTYFSISTLTLFSIWLSELSAISVVILFFMLLLDCFRKNKSIKSLLLFKTEFIYALFTLFVVIVFISYAKYKAVKIEAFGGLNNLNEFADSLFILSHSFTDLITFNAKEPATGIYLIILILSVGLFSIEKKEFKFNFLQKPLLFFLLVECCCIICIILFSKWAYLNNIPRRYFVGSYLFIGLAILIILESSFFLHKKRKLFYKLTLFIIILIGSVGTFYNLLFIWPKTLTPKIKVVSEFATLGNIGIISDYWNSYITACANPKLIKVTPHDKLEMRNKEMTNEVLNKEKIYVISDGWLEEFPDTLNQFNVILVKCQKPFTIGDCNVCLYKKLAK
jgi:hypothetical protein